MSSVASSYSWDQASVVSDEWHHRSIFEPMPRGSMEGIVWEERSSDEHRILSARIDKILQKSLRWSLRRAQSHLQKWHDCRLRGGVTRKTIALRAG